MTTDRIDWSQLWYPGPARRFSADELARAGGDRPSRTFLMVLAFNLAGPGLALVTLAPEGEVARVSAFAVALGWPAWAAAMALWRHPSRRRLMLTCVAALALFCGFAFGLRWRMGQGPALTYLLQMLTGIFGICVIGLWLLSLFRAQQIESRLRELQERERAVEMARRLATAQIQPHFVFNTLATLQHWVDGGDGRASPLLRSLTAYLRAVLPMFQRERLPLGEELEAVSSYLEVMRARLGSRLAFTVEADEGARAATLPPGLVLTLVENAVEHGAQQALGEARIVVSARREGARLRVQVLDNGPGLPEKLTEGLGLTNTRQRLAQTWGEAAQLRLAPRPEGGTAATLDLPCP